MIHILESAFLFVRKDEDADTSEISVTCDNFSEIYNRLQRKD